MSKKITELLDVRDQNFRPVKGEIVWVFWNDYEIWPARFLEMSEKKNKVQYKCQYFNLEQEISFLTLRRIKRFDVCLDFMKEFYKTNFPREQGVKSTDKKQIFSSIYTAI